MLAEADVESVGEDGGLVKDEGEGGLVKDEDEEDDGLVKDELQLLM